MWQFSEKSELPPATLDAVDCRRVADEIPQKFRSEELKPFCIEAFQQQEESPSYGFQNELQTSYNSTKPQSEYASQNDDEVLNSNCCQQLSFVQQIPENIFQTNQEESDNQFLEATVPLWNNQRDNHCSNFSDEKNFDYFNPAVCHTATSQLQNFNCNGNSATQNGCNILNSDNFHLDLAENYSSNNIELVSMNNTHIPMTDDFSEISTSEAESSSENFLQTFPSVERAPRFAIEQDSCSSQIDSATNSELQLQKTSTGALQPFATSTYDCHPVVSNVQKFSPMMRNDFNVKQTNRRENPAIKFHIRTITHCEVECPAPGSFPLSNQTAPFFQPAHQIHGARQPIQDSISSYSNCDLMSNATETCNNSVKPDNGFAPQSMKEIQLVSPSDQILPFQPPVYSNRFQNGVVSECPRVLVHEQRQTSILIGYPRTNNAKTVAGSSVNREISCNQATSQNQEEMQPRSQILHNDSQQTESAAQPTAAQHAISQTAFLARKNDITRSKPKTLATNCSQEASQSNRETNSTTCFNPKPNPLSNVYSSYAPVLGFAPNSFSCFSPNPNWLTAKQSYSKFSSPTAPFDYMMPPSMNFNGNYKVRSGTTPHYRQFDDKFSGFNPSISQQFHPWSSKDTSKNISEKVMKGSTKRRAVKKGVKAEQRNMHCLQCPKRFSKERELQVHVNKHHLQLVKPYFCVSCSKCFKRPDQLKRHEKIHTGEKPHVCSICGRRFARTDHRNTHLKKHASHSSEKFAARKYPRAFAKNGNLLTTNQTNTIPESQIVAEENCVRSKDGFFLPMRLEPVTGSYQPYFINQPPLYENQARSFVPAVHQ